MHYVWLMDWISKLYLMKRKKGNISNCHIIMNTLGNFYFNVYIKFLNVGSIEYRSNKYKTVVSIELTDAEYIETKEMYEFYFKQWKKEVKPMMNDLYEAFLNKYDIFSEDAESDDTEMTPEKWEKILRIMRMSEQLEDVSF